MNLRVWLLILAFVSTAAFNLNKGSKAAYLKGIAAINLNKGSKAAYLKGIAASLLLSPLGPMMVNPSSANAAVLYESMKAEEVRGMIGNGGIDAFSAAGAAMKVEKHSALKDTDIQKVQRGEMKPSEEPRAVKRRVMKACTDDSLTKAAKVSSRECTQRVMAGELDFMLSVMKE